MRALEFIHHNAPFLAAGALLTFCSSFGQTYLISVFAGQIRADFGLGAGDWGTIYAAGTLASAVVMVWAGVLTDHFRARALGAVVLFLLALSCVAMALAPGKWALVAVIFALRFTGQGMTSHIAVVAMARWFVASRGRALSIAAMGFAVGEALLPLILVWLLDFVPWRYMWIGFALFLLLMLPVLARLLRLERTPQSVAQETESTGMFGRHWGRKDALGHWMFWLVVPTILAPSAWSTAFFFQQVHLAQTKGWEHIQLVALFPLFTATSVVAMLGSGWLLDKFGSTRLMPFYLLPMGAGFALMGQTSGLIPAGMAMMLMAITQGSNATLPNAFWAEIYGTRHLGAIKAMAVAVMVLGSAIGPVISGRLIDAGLNFADQMIGIALFFVLAAGLTFVGIDRLRRQSALASQIDV